MSKNDVTQAGSSSASAAFSPSDGSAVGASLSRPQRTALEGVGLHARKVVELFLERADELAFPGVGAQDFVRALSSLSDCNEHLAGAKAALEAQLAEQARCSRQLDSLARRGLAYARVYADGDDELEAVVSKLELGRKPATARRPRVRKQRIAAAESAKELPFQSEAEVA